MQLSILLQNNKLKSILLSILLVTFFGCVLDSNDYTPETLEGGQLSEEEQGAASKVITISVADTVLSGRQGADSRAVETVDIESVSITVRLKDGNEILVRKYPMYSIEQGAFILTAALPVNTDITIEAVGYNSANDITAYGIRSMQVSENEQVTASVSMVLFTPTQLPIVKLTEIKRPPAVSVNGMIELKVSGYVLESEWPADPYGDTIPALNLDFSADVNGSEYETGPAEQFQLLYSDRSGGRISFSEISLSIPADDSAEAALSLNSELSPGGIYVEQLSIPQMEPVAGVTAEPDLMGGIIDLSWTNPSEAWFDGAVLVYSLTEEPRTAQTGTELYRGTLSGYQHTGLTNGRAVHYSVFPYAEEGGIIEYGPGTAVSAVPVDQTPPSAVSGFSASENNGTAGLNWTNPSGEFSRIRVLRKTGSYPTSAYDSSAVCIYDGTGTSVSSSLPAAGTYYFSIFVLDASGNSSAPVNRSLVYYISSGTAAVWSYNYGSLTTSDGTSARASSKYADVYTFTLTSTATVIIDLESYGIYSNWFDTYLYLYSGSTPEYGNYITANDDGGNYLNSRIAITLAPGVYSIEASHYGSYRTGDYRLHLSRI